MLKNKTNKLINSGLKMKLNKLWPDYWKTDQVRMIWKNIKDKRGSPRSRAARFNNICLRDALTASYVFVIRKRGIVQSWAVQLCT